MITLLAACTGPALAASEAGGLANTGIGMVIIAIAAALLVMLLFRSAATHVLSLMTAKTGQRRICRILGARSNSVLSDFFLPGAYGGLTHIDHAVLTSGGLLCIQTKHYSGVVFGGVNEPQWSNVDGIRRRKFLNPLIQNAGRARALQKIIPSVPVASLVVFTGSVQFTSPLGSNVIHAKDLDSYIAKFVFGPCKVDDWNAAWMSVRAAALTDEESRKDFGAQLSFS